MSFVPSRSRSATTDGAYTRPAEAVPVARGRPFPEKTYVEYIGATISSLPSPFRSTSEGEANQPVWPGSTRRLKTGARTGTADLLCLGATAAAPLLPADGEAVARAEEGESCAEATLCSPVAASCVAEPHAAAPRMSAAASRRSGRRQRCTRTCCPHGRPRIRRPEIRNC